MQVKIRVCRYDKLFGCTLYSFTFSIWIKKLKKNKVPNFLGYSYYFNATDTIQYHFQTVTSVCSVHSSPSLCLSYIHSRLRATNGIWHFQNPHSPSSSPNSKIIQSRKNSFILFLIWQFPFHKNKNKDRKWRCPVCFEWKLCTAPSVVSYDLHSQIHSLHLVSLSASASLWTLIDNYKGKCKFKKQKQNCFLLWMRMLPSLFSWRLNDCTRKMMSNSFSWTWMIFLILRARRVYEDS